MAIKMQNNTNAAFSATSMSDLVFLLLIFFMLTSTMVSPNAINLMLPKSDSGKQLASKTIEVYINKDLQYFVNPNGSNKDAVPYDQLLPALQQAASQDKSGMRSIVLRADKTVPIENVVALMDVLNKLNEAFPEGERYKMVLATEGK
mgnify:FL=1